MKFLSTRRRHPLAGLIVVLLGLVSAGVLYSTLAPASADGASKADDELIEQGRSLFVVGCSSCHGLNAEGVMTKGDTNYAPSLIGVGAAAVSFQVGTGRMPMAQPGVQAPEKEVVYTDEEIEALAAYIASLAPGPAIPTEEMTDPAKGDVVTGGGLFFANCTACHNFAATGGALPHGGKAPNLLNTSNQHIYEAMLTGPGQMPVFSNEVLTPEDKRDIIAYIDMLKDQPKYGGSDLGSKGPVSEGLWGWLLGIGALVLTAVWIGNNGVRAGEEVQMSDDRQLSAGGEDRNDDDHLVSAYAAEPIPDPGVHEHELRPTDVDEAAGDRVERQISLMFLTAAVLAILFCVAYFTFDPQPGEAETFMGYSLSNLTLGLTLGGALLLIGIGAIQWAKKLMSDVEIIEHRHNAGSTPEDKAVSLEAWNQGVADSAIGRRPLIRNSLLGATLMLGLPAIVLLRDLGPLPHDMGTTVWRKGMRVVHDITGKPFKPEDMEVGQLINAEPSVFFEQELPDGEIVEAEYEGVRLNNAKAKAAVIVVRMRPQDITPLPEREDWGIAGILCYSKICTHVGCPISLWEQQTHQLLCPCHQSTFDLADNGKVLFGPAARPLPQLPIGVDEEGYVIAMSDFHEPVGPSYWERGRD